MMLIESLRIALFVIFSFIVLYVLKNILQNKFDREFQIIIVTLIFITPFISFVDFNTLKTNYRNIILL
jgi:hypothetical protein